MILRSSDTNRQPGSAGLDFQLSFRAMATNGVSRTGSAEVTRENRAAAPGLALGVTSRRTSHGGNL
jgi:hypothetical protein